MIYEKVVHLCDQNSISIKQLEICCGIGNGTIGKWKESGGNPTVSTLEKIATYFDIPVAYFFEKQVE